MLPSSSQLSKNVHKSPQASSSALLLNSTPWNFPTRFTHVFTTGAACPCAAVLFQVRALLHFCMCSPKQGPKVAEVQDFHKYIWVYSWLQAESHCLGRLWSKVWARFSLHTLAKDLLTSKPACCLVQDTEKRRGLGTRREGDKREIEIRSSSCSMYLLKNAYMTSVHSSWVVKKVQLLHEMS